VTLFLGLGPDSATFRAQKPESWFWSNEHELLAINAEITDAVYRALVAAHSDKNATQPKPLKIPRPGAKRQRGTTMGELSSMFPNMKERR